MSWIKPRDGGYHARPGGKPDELPPGPGPVSGPQLDIESIEARSARIAAANVHSLDWNDIADARQDMPALCREVRQLREQLAWEKSINDGLALQQEGWEEWSNTLASMLPESYDDDAAQEAIIERFVRDSVAALDAAVTPTSQETTGSDKMVLLRLIGQVRLDRTAAYWVDRERRGIHHPDEITAWLSSLIDFGWTSRPVTPTPQETCDHGAGPHSRACGWKAHPHGPDCSVDCPTCAPSGLQRATEQQQ